MVEPSLRPGHNIQPAVICNDLQLNLICLGLEAIQFPLSAAGGRNSTARYLDANRPSPLPSFQLMAEEETHRCVRMTNCRNCTSNGQLHKAVKKRSTMAQPLWLDVPGEKHLVYQLEDRLGD